MRHFLLALLVLTGSRIHTVSNEDVARSFFPDALSAWSRDNPGFAEEQQWSVVPADLDASGEQNYLVIAYSNGHIGRLRILKKTQNGWTLVADPASPALYEKHPRIRLIDVDSDGKPEIVATYTIGNRGQDAAWIFSWKASALQVMNPVDPDSKDNVIAFRSPDFVDLTGSGKLALVQPSDTYGVHEEFATPEESHPVTPDRTCNIYTLSNGRFVGVPLSVVYYGHFARSKGQPKPVEESFASEPGNFTLHVVNGVRGKNLVDSAEVTINGIAVLQPRAFNEQRIVISVPVVLQPQNTIRVLLRSNPGSELRVYIEPAT